jgi:hypothetical protein
MKSVTRILIAVGFFVVAAFFILPLLNNPIHKPAPNAVCRLQLLDIKVAMEGYVSKYASYPTGTQAQIVKTLCGNNPQRYEFLDIHILKFNSREECLDPWGTPLAINFSSTNSFVISSAGPDKIWKTKDDIIFNSISNDFVKP